MRSPLGRDLSGIGKINRGVRVADTTVVGPSAERPSWDPKVLANRLACTTDLSAAAEVCCLLLAELGYELPSLYLRRSGRLRCYASHGYWQVLDGFPEVSGVIASTALTGKPHLVTPSSDMYLEAAPDVASEACVPIVIAGVSVGALNVESTQILPDAALDDLVLIADLFADRFQQIGGVPVPEGWRLLADQAPLLTSTRDEDAIVERCLAVVASLSTAAAAVVALRHDDILRVAGQSGPFGAAIAQIGDDSLEAMSSWVAGPLSCYTVGEPDGVGFTREDSLRVLGLQSLIVASLSSGDDRLGFLALADESAELPNHELIEQIELWAALTASALQTARAIQSLETLSSVDSLTGLLHQRPFRARLHNMSSEERVALLIVDVDHFKNVNDTRGHQQGDEILSTVADAISTAVRHTDVVYRIGGDEFAVLLEPANDTAAVAEIAHRVVNAVRLRGATVSIGVAMNTPNTALFEQADAALYAAKSLGRDRFEFAEGSAAAPVDGG